MSGTLIFRQFGIMLLELCISGLRSAQLLNLVVNFLAASYLQKLLLLACPLIPQISRTLFYTDFVGPFLWKTSSVASNSVEHGKINESFNMVIVIPTYKKSLLKHAQKINIRRKVMMDGFWVWDTWFYWEAFLLWYLFWVNKLYRHL